jgi:hypothetical protein
MKQKSFLLIIITLALFMAGCDSTAKKKSSSSSSNAYCDQYPTAYGCTSNVTCNPPQYGQTQCSNYCQYFICGNTTGSSTGGSTTGGSSVNCNVLPIHNTCPQYCQVYPGAYGCLANGTNCNANPSASGCPGSSTTVNPNWGVHYPPSGTPPAGTCSDAYLPVGSTTAYETRKGTITLAGKTSGSIEYAPFSVDAPNYLNTSPMLMSVAQAKLMFMTDAVVKLRIKVKPQPEAAQTDTMCYGRNMPGSTIPGYTKLQYYVKVHGVSAGNAVTYLGTLGPFITGVNSCSAAMDLSSFKEQSPDGIIVSVDQVKANQNCSSWTNGFSNCNSYKNVRSFDCWSMDFEIAADGTKTFD